MAISEKTSTNRTNKKLNLFHKYIAYIATIIQTDINSMIELECSKKQASQFVSSALGFIPLNLVLAFIVLAKMYEIDTMKRQVF